MSSFGKWSQQGVPKKGWTCIGFEDLGEPSAQCEMCENQDIRYVHQMHHPEYPHILECGCVCAGKMEEDYDAASKRETNSKNLAQRRARWLTRKWKVSQSGNHYLKTDGFHIVVFPKADRWSGTITRLSTGLATQARRLYDTQEKAKLGAFGGMIWLKRH